MVRDHGRLVHFWQNKDDTGQTCIQHKHVAIGNAMQSEGSYTDKVLSENISDIKDSGIAQYDGHKDPMSSTLFFPAADQHSDGLEYPLLRPVQLQLQLQSHVHKQVSQRHQPRHFKLRNPPKRKFRL